MTAPQPPPASRKRCGEDRRLQPLGSIVEHVGNTPLVRIRRVLPEFKTNIEIWAKLEWFNPGGSVKDRAARSMIEDALAHGRMRRDRPLIDSTSGNTGVAYSMVGASLGYPIQLVMPENVSTARKRITRAYGAELIFTDPLEQSDGAIRHVRKLVQDEPEKYFYPDQYSNPENPNAHARTTAKESYDQTCGRITHFVAGLGTSGTVMGTLKGLKAIDSKIQVVAVEPAESLHGLEGLKHMPSSIVPAIYDESLVDEKLSISTDDGWEWAERLCREEGLLAGHSAGAALAGAIHVARALESRGQSGVIVTLFPDRADRYYEPGPGTPKRPAVW
jgi:cysteine synthase B